MVAEQLERYLLAVAQAALVRGLEPPDLEDAQRWLDEWLTAEPARVDPDRLRLLRAVGLRRG